ncbi:MAG: hypothetical protein SW833_18170 [Cyanobacteriota bacterium]|nr:hypothetical protein [Cyanobacteriota bacterium]
MKTQLIQTTTLPDRDREKMYALLTAHFKGVKPEVFEEDLSRKNYVILIKDPQSNQLKGFSTLLFYQTQLREETIGVVYSGDTIMDPSAWSSSALSRAWIAAVKQLSAKCNRNKLYWLLISSGYRTYRFLPVFWQEFFPRYDVPTPAKTRALIDFLANRQFENYYNPQAGIVRFPHPHALREGLRGIPSERLKDPHIAFFQAQNPGHLQGDELVCLAEICEENLTRAGRRMWFADSFKLETSLPMSA